MLNPNKNLLPQVKRYYLTINFRITVVIYYFGAQHVLAGSPYIQYAGNLIAPYCRPSFNNFADKYSKLHRKLRNSARSAV